MPVMVTEEGRSDVRDAPKAAECKACNCSIAGGVTRPVLALFHRTHEGHDQ